MICHCRLCSQHILTDCVTWSLGNGTAWCAYRVQTPGSHPQWGLFINQKYPVYICEDLMFLAGGGGGGDGVCVCVCIYVCVCVSIYYAVRDHQNI